MAINDENMTNIFELSKLLKISKIFDKITQYI